MKEKKLKKYFVNPVKRKKDTKKRKLMKSKKEDSPPKNEDEKKEVFAIYPMNNKRRCLLTLAYARKFPNPSGIKKCVYKTPLFKTS